MEQKYRELSESLEGDLYCDIMTRTIYATDATIYREIPAAVV